MQKYIENCLREITYAIATAAVGALGIGLAVWGISAWLPKPVVPLERFSKEILAVIRPEPRESFTYILMCLLAPFIAWGAVLIVRKWRRQLPFPWFGWGILPLLWWFSSGTTLTAIYFEPVLPWWWLAIAGGTVLFWLIRQYPISNFGKKLLLFLMIFLPVVMVAYSRIYTTYNLHTLFTHHLNIIAYAIAQATRGGTDWHQYGWYAYMLSPVFRVVGTGVFSLSVVMGGLYLAGIWFLCLVIYRSVGAVFALGMTLMMFITHSWGTLNETFFDPYFAYLPIRFFFPALAVMLFFLAEKKFKWWYPIGFGCVGGIAFLWNSDSGIAVIGAFLFMQLLDWVIDFPAAWRRPVFFLSGLSGTILIGWGVACIYTGEWVSPVALWFANRFFYQMGFFMLPMPMLPAPWGLVVLVYLGGLVLGAYQVTMRRQDRFGRIILFLSVLGLGLFIYYQGRSHLFNLIPVSWPAIMIFFMVSGMVMKLHLKLAYHFLPWCACVLMFMPAGTIAMRYDRIGNGLNMLAVGILKMRAPDPIRENVEFLLIYAGGQKKVNISGYNQGIFYAESGLMAGIRNFCREEILVAENIERSQNALIHSRLPFFLSIGPKQGYAWLDPVLKHYRLIARSPNKSMLYFEPIEKK